MIECRVVLDCEQDNPYEDSYYCEESRREGSRMRLVKPGQTRVQITVSLSGYDAQNIVYATEEIQAAIESIVSRRSFGLCEASPG